ncbi:MAG: hypothetical protein ACK5MT_04975 [Actinomycetales bacterium]
MRELSRRSASFWLLVVAMLVSGVVIGASLGHLSETGLTQGAWEFVTSAGFAGLATAGAAILALYSVQIRLHEDRLAALGSDARDRWWRLARYLDKEVEVARDAEELLQLYRLADGMTKVEDVTWEQVEMALWIGRKARRHLPEFPIGRSVDAPAAQALPEAGRGRPGGGLAGDDAAAKELDRLVEATAARFKSTPPPHGV